MPLLLLRLLESCPCFFVHLADVGTGRTVCWQVEARLCDATLWPNEDGEAGRHRTEKLYMQIASLVFKSCSGVSDPSTCVCPIHMLTQIQRVSQPRYSQNMCQVGSNELRTVDPLVTGIIRILEDNVQTVRYYITISYRERLDKTFGTVRDRK